MAQEELSSKFFFTFCHKGGVICVSEVIDISPRNPACASSSPEFLMMYSAYRLNNQGDSIQPWRTPFPIWKHSVVPCPVLTCYFLTCIQISQEAGQVVWYSHLFKKYLITEIQVRTLCDNICSTHLYLLNLHRTWKLSYVLSTMGI